MEKFIRENFKVYKQKRLNGDEEEVFEYETADSKVRITNLSTFLSNQEKFQEIIDYWESQGMNVPQ